MTTSRPKPRIVYLASVPRVPGALRRMLVDAQYADDGHATYEQWADIETPGDVDGAAIARLAGEAVWVGEGSPWALPPAWTRGVEFWVTGDRGFDGSDPLDVNLALQYLITNYLPGYPHVEQIRAELGGRNLAIDGTSGEPTHADVLLTVAAGKVWRP